MAAINADAAKPRFRGTLKGFTIRPPEENFGGTSPKCTGKPGDGAEATAAEINASSLNFDVGYLPDGAKIVFEAGVKCSGDVIGVVRNYVSGESFIVVSNYAGPSNIGVNAPADRLKAATVGRRPTVIVEPIYPRGQTFIYILEPWGYWMVSGIRIERDEVLKIAASIN